MAGYAAWPVHLIDAADIIRAPEIGQRHDISFWDALVVVAASWLGAARLLTGDLGHGQTIAGVRIENPFRTTT